MHRTTSHLSSRRTRTKIAALAIALLLMAGIVIAVQESDRKPAPKAELSVEQCRGAGSLAIEGCDAELADAPVLPARNELLSDTGGAYACYTPQSATSIEACWYGDEDAETRIALVGNSHAAMLAPLFIAAVDERDWVLQTFVGNGCELGWSVRGEPHSERCDGRIAQTREELLAGDFDLIVYAGGRGGTEPLTTEDERITARAWDEIESRGAQVVVVEDNPRLTDVQARCVASASDTDLRAGTCDAPREEALGRTERYVRVAEDTGRPVIRTLDLYCIEEVCPAQVGHVVVYRDDHHLTASYVLTTGVILDRLVEIQESVEP